MKMNKVRNIKKDGGLPVSLMFIISVITIFAIVGCNQPNTRAESIIAGDVGIMLEEKFTPIVNDAMKSHALPGLAIGIVYNNEIVYAKGFGYKNYNTKEPVTASTIFHMASISKPFVATAIMQLVEEGIIDLNDKVTKHLPYFKMASEEYKEVTIRQMLGHISGMPNSNDYEWDKPQYDDGAIERFVKSLATEEMELKPGEKFRYSNIAFEVLGDVIAKVSGESFCDYQKNHILNPSGMTNSTFLKSENLPENWAAPHAMSLSPFFTNLYPYNRRHAPSSTLHSNAIEMCNWAITNISKGSNGSSAILSKSSYEDLWAPWVQNRDGDNAKYGDIGLSWFISEYKGHKTMGHGGSDEGFHANFLILPEDSIAVVVMANILPAPVEELSFAAIDLVLGNDITPVKPLASTLVWNVINEKGVDAAVELWEELNQNNADDYNFELMQFFNLYFATSYGKKDDALKIAEFCNRALPQEYKEYLIGLTEYASEEKPENPIPAQVINLLKGN